MFAQVQKPTNIQINAKEKNVDRQSRKCAQTPPKKGSNSDTHKGNHLECRHDPHPFLRVLKVIPSHREDNRFNGLPHPLKKARKDEPLNLISTGTAEWGQGQKEDAKQHHWSAANVVR